MTDYLDRHVVGGSSSAVGLMPTVLTVSDSFTPPFDMKALVYVIGAGGSGVKDVIQTTTGYYHRGGGAGGCAVSEIELLTSVTYTATIGSGGVTPSGDRQNGQNGGASSFAGSNITTMTANGGEGGQLLGSAEAQGGTASGGNLMNNTGGNGGIPTGLTDFTGGGAVGLWGNGNSATDGGHVYYGRGASLIIPTASSRRWSVGFSPFPFDLNVLSLSRRHGETEHYYYDSIPAGVAPELPIREVDDVLDTYIVPPSGVFAGGTGYGRSNTVAHIRGGDATLGGGGGSAGVLSSSGTRSAAAGSGGTGAIIILPLEAI